MKKIEKEVKQFIKKIEKAKSDDELKTLLKEIKRIGNAITPDELKELARCSCGPKGEVGMSDPY